MPPSQPARRFSLSEDWLATLVGLAIVAVIGLGLLGPGPQSVTLKAAPGESASKTARAIGGWKASATLGGQKAPIAGAPAALETGARYTFACQSGQIAAQPPAAADLPPGSAELALENGCDQAISLAYSTDYALRWPVFGLFKR